MQFEDSIRQHLLSIKPYEPVSHSSQLQGDNTAQELIRNPIIKLNGNENPYGASRKVRDALANFTEYHIYPDPDQMAVRSKLSDYTGMEIDHIVAGSGCDELIDLLLRLTIDPGDEIIDCTPTFGMYSFSTNICGGRVVSVPRDQHFAIDVDKVISAITPRTKMIFIASPNNPTGNLLSESEVLRLVETKTIIVVDETYHEFSQQTHAGLIDSYPNLVILRSLSKWAGLASLRIGYGLMPPAIVNWIMTIKPPYNINAAAELGLLASLDDIDYLKTNVQFIIGERGRVAEQLSSVKGLRPLESAGNFILLETPHMSGRSVYEQLTASNIYVRALSDPRLNNYIRISIGTREQNDKVISSLSQITKNGSE